MKQNAAPKPSLSNSKILMFSHLGLACLLCSPFSAFALTAGSGTLSTIISWLQGIGVLVITIAIIWAAFRIAFQGARINDVAPIFIGGILFGSAPLIASMVIST